MNKGTLPIIARLQSLQAAARVAPGGTRVIAEISDSSPLTALLREINETMIGRSLVFESNAGSSLTVDVSGRRVLRLAAAHGLRGAEACVAAPALDDEHKDDLIKLFQALALPRHELRVAAFPIDRGTEGVSVGLPVALLADLLLVELNGVDDDAAPEPEAEEAIARDDAPPMAPATGFLGQFAQGVGLSLMAWLISGGAEDGRVEGPEEMTAHLYQFLEDERGTVLHQLDTIADSPGEVACIVLGATLIDGHSVLCAREGDAVLLGVIEGDATQSLQRAWITALA